jgi:hypothetical protein
MHADQKTQMAVIQPGWWRPMLVLMVLINLLNLGILCKRFIDELPWHPLPDALYRSEAIPIGLNVFVSMTKLSSSTQ